MGINLGPPPLFPPLAPFGTIYIVASLEPYLHNERIARTIRPLSKAFVDEYKMVIEVMNFACLYHEAFLVLHNGVALKNRLSVIMIHPKLFSPYCFRKATAFEILLARKSLKI